MMKTEHKVLVSAFLLGILVAVIDALLDFLLFYEGTFLEQLIFNIPRHELYHRSVVVICFISFGLIVGRVLNQRGQAMEHSEYLYAVLSAIGNVKQLIAKETDPDMLLPRICELLIETRGYSHSWIVLFDADGQVTGSASAGLGIEFEQTLEMVRKGDWPECMKKAMEQSGAFVFDVPPLKHEASLIESLCREKVALVTRLEFRGGVHGVLGVAAPVGMAAEKELSLFKEVANDIACALHSFEIEDVGSRAHLALMEREKRHRLILNSMNDMILILDKHNRYSEFYASPSLMPYTTPEEFLGKSVADIMPPEIAEQITELTKWVRETGNREILEYELQMNEKELWFSAVLDLHQDGESVIAVVREITERKEAEEALRESEALLNTTGQMAMVGGWILDAKTQEVSWTEETYRIHEIPLDQELRLEDAINFYHPDEREKLTTAIQRALDHGEPYDMELRFITAKGKEIWTHSICKPQVINGKTVKLMGTFQDITNRKKAEEEIEKSAVKYRNLTEESMQGIAIFQDGKYAYANPTVARTVGYTVDEMLELSSERVWELIHIDDREKMKKRFEALEAGLQFLPMIRFRYVGKDGASRWVESFSRRIEHEGKPAVQLLNIDITEQKRFEERLHAAAETALFHLDLMGHDIRNHLQAIIMAADILKQSDLSPEDQQVFDLIVESVQNSQTLIRKIYSTRDLLSVPLSNMQLKDALDESLRRVSESHDDVKIEVEYRVRKGVVKADKFLGNLLTNLLENAVLHNNSKIRHLWVGLSEANEGFKISIADNGPGIPDSKKETLFDPERRFGGVGIHQALRITRKYGGRMNIHDRVHGDSSQGAEFRIWLPKFASSS